MIACCRCVANGELGGRVIHHIVHALFVTKGIVSISNVAMQLIGVKSLTSLFQFDHNSHSRKQC